MVNCEDDFDSYNKHYMPHIFRFRLDFPDDIMKCPKCGSSWESSDFGCNIWKSKDVSVDLQGDAHGTLEQLRSWLRRINRLCWSINKQCFEASRLYLDCTVTVSSLANPAVVEQNTISIWSHSYSAIAFLCTWAFFLLILYQIGNTEEVICRKNQTFLWDKLY